MSAYLSLFLTLSLLSPANILLCGNKVSFLSVCDRTFLQQICNCYLYLKLKKNLMHIKQRDAPISRPKHPILRNGFSAQPAGFVCFPTAVQCLIVLLRSLSKYVNNVSSLEVT